MELKDIRAVIDLMTKNKLAEFELEKKDFKIRIKKQGDAPAVTSVSAPSQPVAVAPPAPVVAAEAPGAADASNEGPSITSPMVGTFYRAPSPDSPSFVEVGTKVNPDSVVCIVEAMKVMNEIKAEASGTITEVLVENGKPVEFGQPLFRIKPA